MTGLPEQKVFQIMHTRKPWVMMQRWCLWAVHSTFFHIPETEKAQHRGQFNSWYHKTVRRLLTEEQRVCWHGRSATQMSGQSPSMMLKDIFSQRWFYYSCWWESHEYSNHPSLCLCVCVILSVCLTVCLVCKDFAYMFCITSYLYIKLFEIHTFVNLTNVFCL